MDHNEEILVTLRQMNAALRLLCADKSKQLLKEVAEKSAKRRSMFRLFNGKRNLKQIAKSVGTTLQAVKAFADECHRSGLVEFVKSDSLRGRIPRRVF